MYTYTHNCIQLQIRTYTYTYTYTCILIQVHKYRYRYTCTKILCISQALPPLTRSLPLSVSVSPLPPSPLPASPPPPSFFSLNFLPSLPSFLAIPCSLLLLSQNSNSFNSMSSGKDSLFGTSRQSGTGGGGETVEDNRDAQKVRTEQFKISTV